MKPTLLAGLFTGLLVALSVGLIQSAPAPGTHLSVRSLNASMMAKPQFLGTSVASLRRGHKVKMVRAEGSWYLVSFEGREGWIHANRVTAQIIRMRAGDTGSGTSRGEAELAGRGFSPKTEEAFKEQNPKLDFTHLDRIQEVNVEPASVGEFYTSGGLGRKAGAK